MLKRTLFYSIFFIACFYLLSAGNASVFSKLKKGCQTEICDIDEDEAGNEEGKDCKEDGCNEEDFLNTQHGFSLNGFLFVQSLCFPENNSFLPQYIRKKNSPPPKA